LRRYDVGTNSVPDATKKTGYRLTGDVDFDEAGWFVRTCTRLALN
jgi:5,10-methylene-tetrahydrofolate dehydrogenase/methenyl tetrahydrofolate cyclohydrolase